MRGQERVHHVNFLQPHQRGVQHFSLPEYSENSGKCISITLSTHVETKATYEQIKAYVKENFGMNVSNLYIAQVKREFGIVERANYNVSVEHYSY